MKIQFLNPPFKKNYSRESRSPAVAKSGTMYYPMWLCYSAGLAEKRGHEIHLIDSPASGVVGENLYNKIAEFNPSLIVMTSSTPGISVEANVASEIKEKLPNAKIVFVGTHASALPEDVLNNYSAIDFIAVGEYDETISELANALENNTDLNSVDGLAFRSGDSIIRTAKRVAITNLDDMPFVSSIYKRFLNIPDYFYSHSKHPIVTIVTSRGCPFQCTYCVLPQTMMGHKLRERTIENVVAEFKYIKENYPDIQEIMIEDDTLTVNKNRTIELSKRLIEEKINIPWTANSRADVDEEALIWIAKAGCRLLCVGFESGEQEILNNIKKSMKVETYAKFRKSAKKAGVMIHGCFLVGNKGETKETLRKTLNMAKALNPDTAQFFPLMIYPGTEAYAWASENNFMVSNNYSDWLNDEGLHECVVSTDKLTSQELVQFCDDARREFYLRPRYMFYKLVQSIKNPAEGKRNLKAGRTLLKYIFRGTKHKQDCGCKK